MLLLWADKSALGGLATHPEAVRGVLRLNDKREQRQSEGFRAAWLAWMRAQVFLQFLPGLQLVSDELIDPHGNDFVSESITPAIRPASRVTPFPGALTKKTSMLFAADVHQNQPPLRRQPAPADFKQVLKGLDEAVHPLLRGAYDRGFSECAVPFELVGPNGVEGEIEVAWPVQQVGLYLEHQSEIARRLLQEGWRLLAIEARPSPAQLLELLEAQ
jgi:hypothetical protein